MYYIIYIYICVCVYVCVCVICTYMIYVSNHHHIVAGSFPIHAQHFQPPDLLRGSWASRVLRCQRTRPARRHRRKCRGRCLRGRAPSPFWSQWTWGNIEKPCGSMWNMMEYTWFPKNYPQMAVFSHLSLQESNDHLESRSIGLILKNASA